MEKLVEWLAAELPNAEFRYLSLKEGQPEGVATAFRLGRLEVLQQVNDILEGREPRVLAQTQN